MREYYKKYPHQYARHKALVQKWNIENKQRVYRNQLCFISLPKNREKAKAYYQKNREKILAYCRKYKKTHREQIKNYMWYYFKVNPDQKKKQHKRVRDWQKRNPDKVRLYNQKWRDSKL